MKKEFQRLNLPCELGPDPGQPSLFGCHRLWKVEEDESYVVRAYPLSSHVIIYTYEGCGDITVDGRAFELRPFSLFLVKAGTLCGYRCRPGALWKFHFLMCIRDDAMRHLKLACHTVYPSESASNLTHAFESILREGMAQRPGFGLKIDALATDILLHYVREAEDKGAFRENTVKAAREWMRANFAGKLELDRWIKKSGFCRTRFFREFHALTGTSPIQYFNDLKLEAARLMIENQPRRIREIAEDLSFFDEYYFSRLFKRRYGSAPSAYRRRFRNGSGSE